MIVYLHGSPGKPPVESHTLIICPAGHVPNDCPEAFWWASTGKERKPLTWHVEFKYGQAEVEEPVGKYLISTDMAKPDRYQPSNFWTP